MFPSIATAIHPLPTRRKWRHCTRFRPDRWRTGGSAGARTQALRTRAELLSRASQLSNVSQLPLYTCGAVEGSESRMRRQRVDSLRTAHRRRS